MSLVNSNALAPLLLYLLVTFWLGKRLTWTSANTDLYQTGGARLWLGLLSIFGVFMFVCVGGLVAEGQQDNPAVQAWAFALGLQPNVLNYIFVCIAFVGGAIDEFYLSGGGEEKKLPTPSTKTASN